jgi:hypothetical protein
MYIDSSARLLKRKAEGYGEIPLKLAIILG